MAKFSRKALAHALHWEEAHGDPTEDQATRSRRICNHLSERATYYAELETVAPSGFEKAAGYAATPFNLGPQGGATTGPRQKLPDRKIWAADDEVAVAQEQARASENRRAAQLKQNLVFDMSGFDGAKHTTPTLRYLDDAALRSFFEQETAEPHMDREMLEALEESRARLSEVGKRFQDQRRKRSRFFQGVSQVGRKQKKSPLLPVFPTE